MEKPILDLTAGISSAARAVAAILNTPDYIIGSADDVRTAAWYNGRETGYVVYVSGKRETLLVVFGEVRNTDQTFVDCWRVPRTGWINPPTVADFTDEAYGLRHTFMSYEKAAARVAASVRAFLESEAGL